MPDGLVRTQPLSAGQRVRLIMRSLRVLIVLVPFALYLVFLTPLVGQPKPAFYALAAAVALFVGYDSFRGLRDLLAGVVEVRDDVLVKSRASRGPGRHFFGEYQHLGRVSMSAKAHFGSRNGAVHRVTYSPTSRYVWLSEPYA